jgi:hypothetical protein
VSEKLITSKLMVCGNNPRLNGFTGSRCRLQSAHQHSVVQRKRARYQQPEQETDREAEAAQLAEVTCCSTDRCLAALLAHDSVEDAVAWLLEGRSSPSPHKELHTNDRVDEAVVQQFMDISGRSKDECEKALRMHPDNVDGAAVWLLSMSNGSPMKGDAPEVLELSPSTSENSNCEGQEVATSKILASPSGEPLRSKKTEPTSVIYVG